MTDPVTVFHPRRLTIAVMTLAGIAMSALGLMMATGVIPVRAGTSQVPGWIAAVFFAIFTPLWARQLFIRGPVIEVTHEGVRDLRFSPDIVTWDVIEDVVQGKSKGTRYLLLKLKKGTQQTFSCSWLRRAWDFTNAMFGLKGVYIAMLGTSGTVEDLVTAIDRTAPKRLSQRLSAQK